MAHIDKTNNLLTTGALFQPVFDTGLFYGLIIVIGGEDLVKIRIIARNANFSKCHGSSYLLRSCIQTSLFMEHKRNKCFLPTCCARFKRDAAK